MMDTALLDDSTALLGIAEQALNEVFAQVVDQPDDFHLTKAQAKQFKQKIIQARAEISFSKEMLHSILTNIQD